MLHNKAFHIFFYYRLDCFKFNFVFIIHAKCLVLGGFKTDYLAVPPVDQAQDYMNYSLRLLS